MSGGWRSARLRRRVAFGVCGAALVALAAVLRAIDDVSAASVLVSVIGAVVSVAALLADVLRGDADPLPRPAAELRHRAADALADAVREQWAAEFRLRRLQDPEPVDVRWVAADPRLADHPENVLRIPAPRDGERQLGGIVNAFAAVPGRRLVVLGGPGSGKSVLALRFTLGRLAVRRPGGAVPVIFPLAGWDPRHSGLRDWLAERLAADYRPLAALADGRRTMARALLDTGLVLPVLDGFDELPQAVYGEAVRRINAELDDDLPLLLTSRPQAWATAVDEGDVLTAAQVVKLLPLDIGQSAAYLERTARPLPADGGRRATVWTPVLRYLEEEPGHPLAAVLTVPLMVALARTVYGDRSRDPAELLDDARFESAERIEEHLLEAFVPAASHDAGDRGAVEARRRLGALARELQKRGTGRLGWWELEAMAPRVLRVYAPGLVAMAATAVLLVPGLLSRASSDLATVEDAGSLVMNLVGQTLGYSLGVAFLLQPVAGRVRRIVFLRRQLAITTAAAGVLWAGFALGDDLRFGYRFGAVTDGWLPDMFGGCLFALLFTLFFGIAGLPRRPVPLSLPWAGDHRGRRRPGLRGRAPGGRSLGGRRGTARGGGQPLDRAHRHRLRRGGGRAAAERHPAGRAGQRPTGPARPDDPAPRGGAGARHGCDAAHRPGRDGRRRHRRGGCHGAQIRVPGRPRRAADRELGVPGAARGADRGHRAAGAGHSAVSRRAHPAGGLSEWDDAAELRGAAADRSAVPCLRLRPHRVPVAPGRRGPAPGHLTRPGDGRGCGHAGRTAAAGT
ncbi:NACHT domain-containing protein [Streptomyces sp. Lzd4kr]|nr:NACHT domain-containing protein [Streptomyces sp. Lzd4kr]